MGTRERSLISEELQVPSRPTKVRRERRERNSSESNLIIERQLQQTLLDQQSSVEFAIAMTHGVNTSGSEEYKKTLKHYEPYHIVVVALDRYSMFIATVVYWNNAEMGQLSDVRKAFRWHGFIHTVACGGHSLKKASPHAAVHSISKICCYE